MDYLLNGLRQAWLLILSGDGATMAAVHASLSTAAAATFFAMLLGAPLGVCLGFFRFPGRNALRILSNTLLSFPTVVVGLVVYILINNRGPLGSAGMLFTLPGVAFGLFLLALPLVVSLSASAVEQGDRRLKTTLLTLGAGSGQMLRTTIWELRYSLLTALIMAFSRVVSEVGIAMMVGGNIKWHTRTMTTAISLETGKGEFAQGIALGAILLGVSLLVNIALAALKNRRAA